MLVGSIYYNTISSQSKPLAIMAAAVSTAAVAPAATSGTLEVSILFTPPVDSKCDAAHCVVGAQVVELPLDATFGVVSENLRKRFEHLEIKEVFIIHGGRRVKDDDACFVERVSDDCHAIVRLAAPSFADDAEVKTAIKVKEIEKEIFKTRQMQCAEWDAAYPEVYRRAVAIVNADDAAFAKVASKEITASEFRAGRNAELVSAAYTCIRKYWRPYPSDEKQGPYPMHTPLSA